MKEISFSQHWVLARGGRSPGVPRSRTVIREGIAWPPKKTRAPDLPGRPSRHRERRGSSLIPEVAAIDAAPVRPGCGWSRCHAVAPSGSVKKRATLTRAGLEVGRPRNHPWLPLVSRGAVPPGGIEPSPTVPTSPTPSRSCHGAWAGHVARGVAHPAGQNERARPKARPFVVATTSAQFEKICPTSNPADLAISRSTGSTWLW